MERLSLQFQGVENAGLLSILGWAIALSLMFYGLWRLIVRRRRGGLWALFIGAGSAGWVAVAALGVPLDQAGGRVFWLAGLGATVVAAVAVFYSAVYAYLGRRRITTLLVLRCLAILALLLILFKPAVSVHPAPGGRKLGLAVLVDRSASMDTIDHADLPNRYRQSIDALLAQQRRLEKRFAVGWNHFATRVEQVEGPDELAALAVTAPECQTTDVAAALRRAIAGYGADESAGIVLISDGLHNADGNVLDVAAESPVPIYAIGVGADSEQLSKRRNVRLLSVDAPLEAVKNNVATVVAKVRLTGWANIASRAVLRAGGKELASKQVSASSNSQELEVEMNWTPGEPAAGLTGPDIRKLVVAVEPNPAEVTTQDNAAELHVLVIEPSVRVLYVEGRLRPEYKFLCRALASDPNLKLISMVRQAKNQFLSQGSIDGKQLTDLPRSDEDFKLFDVIVLGDLDRTFLTNDQMDRIRRFVNDGKALLMLAGRNSFGPGAYGGTPVEAALPVICGGRLQGQETTPFVPQLTAAGLASPVFAGITKYFGSPTGKAVEPVPQLLGCVTVLQAKPAASVLAIHPSARNASGRLVVLATHRYGAGRAAAFTGYATWRWYMRLRPLGTEGPYHRFWGQLVRYLAGVEQKKQPAGASVLARIDKAYLRQNEELRVIAQVKDASGQRTADATVTASLRPEPPADGKPATAQPVEIALEAVKDDRGLYQATHRPSRSGGFVLTVTAADAKGAALGSDELKLTVAPHSRESDRLARDAKTLKAVAEATKGRYAELSALPDVIDEIIARQKDRLLPAARPSQHPLYNFPLLFLVFVGLLTAEWLIRRNWQLQ